MQWMAVSQKQLNLEGRQMQVKGESTGCGYPPPYRPKARSLTAH